jgi:hypothetical protein
LPFFEYARTMQDNAIAAFHRDVYREWIVEMKLWKLTPSSSTIRQASSMCWSITGTTTSRAISSSAFPEPSPATASQRRKIGVSAAGQCPLPSTIAPSSTTRRIILDSTHLLLARWSALPSGAAIEVPSEMAQLTLEIISRILFSSDSAELAPIMERTFAHQPEKIFDLLDFRSSA